MLRECGGKQDKSFFCLCKSSSKPVSGDQIEMIVASTVALGAIWSVGYPRKRLTEGEKIVKC